MGLAQNGSAIALTVGERLLVVLPRPDARELGDEQVRSSDESVLQLEAGATPGPGVSSVLEVPFRGLRPGTSVVTVSGLLGYRLVVQVRQA